MAKQVGVDVLLHACFLGKDLQHFIDRAVV